MSYGILSKNAFVLGGYVLGDSVLDSRPPLLSIVCLSKLWAGNYLLMKIVVCRLEMCHDDNLNQPKKKDLDVEKQYRSY